MIELGFFAWSIIAAVGAYFVAMMMSQRVVKSKGGLGGFENMYIHLESPERCQFVSGVLRFEEPLGLERFHSIFQHLSEKNQRLRMRVTKSKIPFRHALADDPSFNLQEHLRVVSLEGSGDDDDLRAKLEELMSTGLPRTRPLWEAVLVNGLSDGGCACFLKLHHVLGDGMAANMFLLSVARLADGRDPAEAGAEMMAQVARKLKKRQHPPILEAFTNMVPLGVSPQSVVLMVLVYAIVAPLAYLWELLRAVWYVLHTVAVIVYDYYRAHFHTRDFLVTSATRSKKVRWSVELKLEDVKKVKNALKVTVNDVLVNTVTGAVRRVIEQRGERVPKTIFAPVPVSLRHPLDGGEALQNKTAGVWNHLPTGLEDPLERLHVIRESMEVRKRNMIYIMFTVYSMHLLANLPKWFSEFIINHYLNKSPVIFTNVPGPQEELFVDGIRVTDIMIFGLQPGAYDGGASFSCMTYNGKVSLTLVDDAELPEHASHKDLLDSFHHEFNELRMAIGV